LDAKAWHGGASTKIVVLWSATLRGRRDRCEYRGRAIEDGKEREGSIPL